MSGSPSIGGSGLSAAVQRVGWGWLTALSRQLDAGVDICDVTGEFCALGSRSASAPWPQRRLAAVVHDAALQAAVRAAAEGRFVRLALEGLEIGLAPIEVGDRPALFVVGRDGQQRGPAVDFEPLVTALARAVEAHLAQGATQDHDAFDRVASLHRLLHEAIEHGSERDVVTAFAEAVFAWDGIETSGYAWDVDGQLTRLVAAPGARRSNDLVSPGAASGLELLTPLSAEQAERFGVAGPGPAFGAELRASGLEPWILIFAEGFAPLHEARLRLYVDLLREALARAAAIAGTRLAWSVLQPLLGAGEPDAASTASLTELTRALPAQGAQLLATAPGGQVVLNVGDDEQGSVRPFGRLNRLVATARTSDGYVLNLAVRRAPADHFTRREQHVLDRTVGVFATWLARLLAQGPLRERTVERRDFDVALDRAAAQAVREGQDVSVVVITAPELVAHAGVQRTWVADLRGRLRGSDLAGALSETEVGILLCGTTPDTVDAVSARLCRHLKLGERGIPAGAIGTASVAAGSVVDGSLVQKARRAVTARAANEKGGRR